MVYNISKGTYSRFGEDMKIRFPQLTFEEFSKAQKEQLRKGLLCANLQFHDYLVICDGIPALRSLKIDLIEINGQQMVLCIDQNNFRFNVRI